MFADVDGDHNIDAISLSGNGVFVWRGRGDGSFDPPRVFVGGLTQGPLSLVVGDFDGDGHPDIVTPATGNEQFFFKGKGDGSFDAPEAYCCGRTPTAAAGADLNHDGLVDIVAVAHGGLDTYINIGGGRFRREARTVIPFDQDASLYLYVGDFDGDGIPDIALVESNTSPERSRMVVYFRDANGAFQWTPIMEIGTTTPIGIGTFHAHDARAQVVFSHRGNQFTAGDRDRTALVTVPRNGLFTTDSFSRYVMSVVDADGDGLTDVVLPNNTTTPYYIGFNDGTARFTFVPSTVMPIGVSGGEGLAYGAVADPARISTIGPWRKQFRRIHRDRTLGEPTFVGTDLGYFRAAGDFDGDGQPDLVSGSVVLLNRGNDTYVASELIEGYPIAFGDMDGDGRTDALVKDDELIIPILNRPVPRGSQTVTLALGRSIVYDPTPPYYADQTFGVLSATANGQPVAGVATIRSGNQVVAFYELHSNAPAQPDLRLPAGVTNLSIEFNGPPEYATASLTAPWTILPLPIIMFANPNGNYAGFPITVSTDLTSARSGQPLPGPVTGTVDFIVNGKVEATLQPNGTHVAVTKSFAAGSYGIAFRYNGDPNELPGSSPAGGVFTVVDPPVAFDKTKVTVVQYGPTSFRIAVTLNDRDGNPLPPSLNPIGVSLKASAGQPMWAAPVWLYTLPIGVTGALLTATVNDVPIASTFVGTPQPHHRPAGK